MKAFHPQNGWLYKVVGGPLDTWDLRMTATENKAVDGLPVESFELTGDKTGTYVLQQVVGKTAKYRGTQVPRYHYVWSPDGNT